MIRKAFAIIVEHRFFAVAIAISIIFHFAILSNLLFKSGSPQAVASGSFTVKLAKLEAIEQTGAIPNPDLKKSQDNVIKPAEKVRIKTQASEKPLKAKKMDKAGSAEPRTKAASPTQALEAPIIPDPNSAAGVFHAPTTPVTQTPPNTPSIRQTFDAYQYVETEFETVQTSDPTTANASKNETDVLITSKVIFIKNTEKNTYQLLSTTQENNGAGTTQISSEGAITAFGLKPNRTIHSNANHTKYTDYYWADGILEEYENESNKVAKKLTANAQDELSDLYQFMFNPPKSQESNAPSPDSQYSGPEESLNSSDYTFLGEEILQTKLGEIKTIHLLKNDKLTEETELWLAVEYHYLPVKFRKKDNSGRVTERIVSSISLSPPQSDGNIK